MRGVPVRAKNRILIAKLMIPAAIVPLMVQGFGGGPPAAVTGAPNEQTCFQAGCHQTATGAFFDNSNAIQIEFPSGAIYVPGTPQNLTIRIADPQAQVFGFELSPRTGSNAAAGVLESVDVTTRVLQTAQFQYLQHTVPRQDGAFSFRWTPPSENVGTVTFYVASNAANNNFNPSGDRIHARQITVEPAGPAGERPIISQNGVLHGATFTTAQGFGPNTFGTVFGTNIVQTTDEWSDNFVENVAPTRLGGARVLVNGKPAFLSFTGRAQDFNAATDQINFVFPADEMRGDVQVVVETDQGPSDPVTIQLSGRAPAFFPYEPQGRRYAAAIMNDASAYIGPADLFGGAPLPLPVPIRPARTGDVIQLFGTGFGVTDPAVPIGQIPPAGTVANTVDPVAVRLGETPATVLFAGLSPFVGVYQIVIQLPAVANGDHELSAEIGGQRSQTGIFLAVQNP